MADPSGVSARHDCGHGDSLEVLAAPEHDTLVVRAVDGRSDPVEGAFDQTTVRVDGSAARGSTVADLAVQVPAHVPSQRDGYVALRVQATFDDGITECSWTAVMPGPRRP